MSNNTNNIFQLLVTHFGGQENTAKAKSNHQNNKQRLEINYTKKQSRELRKPPLKAPDPPASLFMITICLH